MTEPYRPSNGTEGDIFMDKFCFNCKNNPEENPCLILRDSLAYHIDNPHYPKEWIEDEKGERCTAFQDIDDLDVTPRCEKTTDMFKESE